MGSLSLPETIGKTVPDAWDFKGRPADKSKSGGWAAASMILGLIHTFYIYHYITFYFNSYYYIFMN